MNASQNQEWIQPLARQARRSTAALTLTLAALSGCIVVSEEQPTNGAGGERGSRSGGACGDVPSSGVCLSPSEVARCVVPTGQGVPGVQKQICAPYEQCQVVSGKAACVVSGGKCLPGSSKCQGAGSALVCDDTGRFVEVACEGCSESPVGAVCDAGPTVVHHGTIAYEARLPNAGFTDWDAGPPSVFAAAGQLVGSLAGPDQALIDASYVNDDGTYSIKVPKSPSPDDRVVFLAVRPTADGQSLAFAVGLPGVPGGEWDTNDPVPSTQSDLWGWSVPSGSLAPNDVLVIGEANGSGAASVFDYLRYVHESVADLTGREGTPLVMWLRQGTEWDCGACSVPTPINVGGYPFGAQIFIPGAMKDQAFWSSAVIAHELGHWVMDSYGVSPREGGPHCVGVPTLPGQAWSEGWATGFSSLVRADPRYFDKQEGSFFWLDIASRSYSNSAWQRPSASEGLLQDVDENEVASMLWNLADHPAAAGATLPANARYLEALGSPRMMGPSFARGYTRHQWSMNGCIKTGVVDTGEPAPMLADFLDALVCAGESPAAVDAATEPAQHYPYPSQQPICN